MFLCITRKLLLFRYLKDVCLLISRSNQHHGIDAVSFQEKAPPEPEALLDLIGSV